MERTLRKNNAGIKVLGPEGLSVFSGIKRVSARRWLRIQFKNNTEIECTHRHLFKSVNGFKRADRFSEEDKIITKDGTIEILKIEQKTGNKYFYDLTDVEKNSEYYTNGILSHNCNIFMGSIDTLVKMSTLRELVPEDPIYNKDNVKVYNQPEAGHNYITIVDTGHGKGLNYSAFSIIDITEYPFKQVATFRADDISPFMYPNIILKMANQYNRSWVVIENNDMGSVVASIFNYDFEYQNMINPKDIIGEFTGSSKSLKYEVGTRTTTRTKAIGCATLKDLVEGKKLILQDEQTIVELMSFIAKGKSYEADENCYDDMVMTLVIFSWFSTMELFDEIFHGGRKVSKELYERRIQEALEDLPPALFIDDGVNAFRYDLQPGEELW